MGVLEEEVKAGLVPLPTLPQYKQVCHTCVALLRSRTGSYADDAFSFCTGCCTDAVPTSCMPHRHADAAMSSVAFLCDCRLCSTPNCRPCRAPATAAHTRQLTATRRCSSSTSSTTCSSRQPQAVRRSCTMQATRRRQAWQQKPLLPDRTGPLQGMAATTPRCPPCQQCSWQSVPLLGQQQQQQLGLGSSST